MAANSSIARAVVWNWVIEALANYEQIQTSTLIGLVKMAPEILGDLGKDSREIVSLRILDSLFLHGNESIVDGDSAQNAKISFDPSECCEIVLKKILHETPEVMSNLEKDKWDVGPFIMHKKSSLPKCKLEKLKELIVEDSHPLFAKLKEMSSLEITKDTVAKDGLPFPNPRKDKNKIQEKADEVSNGNDSVQNSINDEPSRSVKISVGHDGQLETSGNSERTECTLNQNSLTMVDRSKIDICIKCNESGELLICSSDSCPIRVHESCSGSSVKLDEDGKFLCPICAYSHAKSEYMEAKRKASLAKKNLQVFLRFKVKHRRNESYNKESELERNEENGNRNCEESDLSQQTTDLPQNPNTPKQKSKKKEKEIQKSDESCCSRNLRKRKVQYTFAPVIPISRRRIVPWTKSEEETLKEGVGRYLSGDNKGIPWKEILEYGGNVFQKGRTPIDLKDKWRNICKGSPRV